MPGTPGVAVTQFPSQGTNLGKKVAVCFNRDTSNVTTGEIVRDDVEEPWATIIRLHDGRYVLGVECQYSTM